MISFVIFSFGRNKRFYNNKLYIINKPPIRKASCAMSSPLNY